MKSPDRERKLRILLSMFAMTLMFISVQAWGGETGQPEGGEQSGFSEEQINCFASAHIQIVQAQQEYEIQFANANNDAERQDVMQRANHKMMNILQTEGISVEEFNAIAREAQINPGLREEIRESQR